MDLQYTIRDISLLEYRIEEKATGFSIPADTCKVNADITIHFSPDTEEVVFHYFVKYTDKRSDEKLMTYGIKMIVRVLEFSKVFDRKRDSLTIPDALLVNFVRILTGAARGILAIQNQGFLSTGYLFASTA